MTNCLWKQWQSVSWCYCWLLLIKKRKKKAFQLGRWSRWNKMGWSTWSSRALEVPVGPWSPRRSLGVLGGPSEVLGGPWGPWSPWRSLGSLEGPRSWARWSLRGCTAAWARRWMRACAERRSRGGWSRRRVQLRCCRSWCWENTAGLILLLVAWLGSWREAKLLPLWFLWLAWFLNWCEQKSWLVLAL